MSPNKYDASAARLIQEIKDAIFRAVEHEEGAIEEAYNKLGIDRNELVEDITGRTKTLQLKVRRDRAKAKAAELLAIISDFKSKPRKGSRDDLLAELRGILGSEGALAFHKLESLKEEDLLAMLEELDIVKLLDQQSGPAKSE